MITLQIPPLPDLLFGVGVETGCSVSAEVNLAAPLFDHRDRGCVAVVPVIGGLQRLIVETLILWTTSPVLRSPQTANSSDPPLRAAVNQMWSPETTGDDQPSSWIADFPWPFFALPNSAGSLA